MHQSIPAEHAQHDLDLIAGHAAGDLSTPERTRAEALLRSCASCSDLREDLVAIAAATRTLPAPAAPRDYRLTDTQAARLRRGGYLGSLLRPFATRGSATRPLAMAFTSLGLAGLLVANVLPALFGSAGAAAPALAPEGAGALALPSAGAAATMAPAYPAAGGPQATDGRNSYEFGPQSQPTAASGGAGKADQATSAPAVAAGGAQSSPAGDRSHDMLTSREADRLQETNWMLVGSVGLLAVGLALFGLRFLARRVR